MGCFCSGRPFSAWIAVPFGRAYHGVDLDGFVRVSVAQLRGARRFVLQFRT
jgi:hypothetical protein